MSVPQVLSLLKKLLSPFISPVQPTCQYDRSNRCHQEHAGYDYIRYAPADKHSRRAI